MNGGDLVDRGVIWLYTVEGVLMFQSNKLYLKMSNLPYNLDNFNLNLSYQFYVAKKPFRIIQYLQQNF